MDPAKNAKWVKSRIGVQLQTSALFNRLTVRETLVMMASFFPKHRNLDDLLAVVDLKEKENTQTRNLSGGQQQRLQLASAMINDGDIIFLDEPTTGLDPQARRNLWDVIEHMKNEGKTIFLTTHYMDEAERLCDRVAVIDQGKVIALDSPEGLIRTHFKETAIELVDVFKDDDTLITLPGVGRIQHEDGHVTLFSSAVPNTVSALLELSEQRRMELRDLVMRRATLEDVFLKLTGRRMRE
jgi:ABC-2 type transport system ATP-binding protein